MEYEKGYVETLGNLVEPSQRIFEVCGLLEELAETLCDTKLSKQWARSNETRQQAMHRCTQKVLIAKMNTDIVFNAIAMQ